MQLDVKTLDKFLSITPQEKSIETFNSRDFKTKVIDLVNQNRESVILNLSKVDFIDSNGLGSLIALVKLLASYKSKMVICEAKDPVKRIFNLTRLDQVLPLFVNEEEAKKFLIESVKAGTNV